MMGARAPVMWAPSAVGAVQVEVERAVGGVPPAGRALRADAAFAIFGVGVAGRLRSAALVAEVFEWCVGGVVDELLFGGGVDGGGVRDGFGLFRGESTVADGVLGRGALHLPRRLQPRLRVADRPAGLRG